MNNIIPLVKVYSYQINSIPISVGGSSYESHFCYLRAPNHPKNKKNTTYTQTVYKLCVGVEIRCSVSLSLARFLAYPLRCAFI